MIAYCVGHPDQPSPIFDGLQDIGCGEELYGVRLWAPQRFEQPRRNQNRDIMRLAVQNPSRLLRRQTARQLPEQHQEPLLILSHGREA